MKRHLCAPSAEVLLLVLGLVAVSVSLAACGGDSGPPASPSATADAVAATVNGQAVSRSAVEAVRAEYLLGGSTVSEKRALKEAITRELMHQEAERLGVVASAVAVRRRRAVVVDEVGSESALKSALANVPMTEAQLQRSLEDGVLREAVEDARYAQLASTPKATRAYYERHRDDLFRQAASVHLGAIQVKAEMIAESALKRLREGRPFSEVARQFTIDPEAEANDGDLGWLLLSSLPRPLRKAVATLDRGEVSKPVAYTGGWWVLKVFGARAAHVTPFASVRKSIADELTRKLRSEALDAWLDGARERAEIVTP